MADQQSIRVLTERLARERRVAAEALKHREEELERIHGVVARAMDLVVTCEKHYPEEGCLGCKVWGVLVDA